MINCQSSNKISYHKFTKSQAEKINQIILSNGYIFMRKSQYQNKINQQSNNSSFNQRNIELSLNQTFSANFRDNNHDNAQSANNNNFNKRQFQKQKQLQNKRSLADSHKKETMENITKKQVNTQKKIRKANKQQILQRNERNQALHTIWSNMQKMTKQDKDYIQKIFNKETKKIKNKQLDQLSVNDYFRLLNYTQICVEKNHFQRCRSLKYEIGYDEENSDDQN